MQYLRSFVGPVVKSAILHALVFGLLVYSWIGLPKPPERAAPNTIKANLVEMPKPMAKPTQPKVQPKDEQKKREQEKQKKIREKQRQERLAKEKAEKAEKARKKALVEKRKKEKVAREKAEQARKEKELQLAEKKKAEEARQAELENLRLKEVERLQALEQLREQEKQRLDSLQSLEEQKITNQYILAIQQQIQRTWSRPPNARKGMQTTLRIKLIPGGEVLSVNIVTSSGNAAFDRSAEQAVHRAGILPVPPDPDTFDKHFRTVELIFKPEDL